MVQDVTIPLSWANNIPGVSGVEDVTFQVPTLQEIDQAVEDATLGPEDVETAIEDGIGQALADATFADEFINAVVDPLVEAIEDATGLDFPSPKEIAAEITDEIDIPGLEDIQVEVGGSLFAVNEDFVDLLAAALNQVDFVDVEDFPSLTELQEDLDAVLSGLDELDVPTVDDITDAVSSELRTVLNDVLPDWLTMDLDDLIDELGRRIADRLVSDDVQQSLEDSLDNTQ